MTGAWPWLTLAGLGAFHGLNPAMGWLFAVALGLHRRSRGVVALAVVPIALGHAAAVTATLALLLGLGFLVDTTTLRRAAGLGLIGFALWQGLYGHRLPVRVGMRTGMAGLASWSFAMALAHGAGLMLVPILIPLCLSGTTPLPADASLGLGLAALGVHTAAMLTVTAAVALAVYGWLGVGFLRRGWLNLDLLWTAALVVAGVILLA